MNEELAMRCSNASPDEQSALLREVYEAVRGPKPPRIHGGSQELTDWLDHFNPFYGMLTAKAYESAALYIKSPTYYVEIIESDPDDSDGETYVTLRPRWEAPDELRSQRGQGQTIALALCAAILRTQP